MPSSCRVGTLGQFLVRAGLQVTRRRKSPEFTSAAQLVESAWTLMWPPSVAALSSAPPLKGTCVHFTPVALAICSMPMCRLLPVPGEPYLILPGLALAYSMNSLKFFHGESDLTTTPKV